MGCANVVFGIPGPRNEREREVLVGWRVFPPDTCRSFVKTKGTVGLSLRNPFEGCVSG